MTIVRAMTKRDAIVALDKKRVWHPYTEMTAYIEQTEPLVVERAEGARIFDVDGRSFIDGNASWWVALLGHRHPRLMRVLREQSEKLCHVALAGITHEHAALLGEEICAVAPDGLEHVFYSDDGSTSVEVALKQALQLFHNEGKTQKQRFLALDEAFHGDTLGVTGLGGVEVFRAPFAQATVAVTHLPVPPESTDDPGYEDAVNAARQLIEGKADELAAVVVEPVLQGAAGMRVYAPAFLRELRTLCDAHDVLLVFDEVFTGYGRTGPMWACEHAGVTPDILCTAKGFSGGVLPMAATLSTRRVFDAFKGEKQRAFYYGHTYCGHALGAALAREVLAIYREEKILEQAKPKAEKIRAAFDELAALPGVTRVRSLGMMGALDLGGDDGYLARAGWDVYERALARGAYLRPLGNTVYVTPPLNIPDADLDELLDVVAACVADQGANGSR